MQYVMEMRSKIQMGLAQGEIILESNTRRNMHGRFDSSAVKQFIHETNQFYIALQTMYC